MVPQIISFEHILKILGTLLVIQEVRLKKYNILKSKKYHTRDSIKYNNRDSKKYNTCGSKNVSQSWMKTYITLVNQKMYHTQDFLLSPKLLIIRQLSVSFNDSIYK